MYCWESETHIPARTCAVIRSILTCHSGRRLLKALLLGLQDFSVRMQCPDEKSESLAKPEKAARQALALKALLALHEKGLLPEKHSGLLQQFLHMKGSAIEASQVLQSTTCKKATSVCTGDKPASAAAVKDPPDLKQAGSKAKVIGSHAYVFILSKQATNPVTFVLVNIPVRVHVHCESHAIHMVVDAGLCSTRCCRR